jgi:hypothetical protein
MLSFLELYFYLRRECGRSRRDSIRRAWSACRSDK